MTEEQFNVRALTEYQQAREKMGIKSPGGAKQFAIDRVLGGDTFKKVMVKDMSHYITQERQVAHYEEQTREMTIVIYGLELQVNQLREQRDLAQEAREAAQSEVKQQAQALDAQTKEMGVLRTTVAEQEQTIATLKEAAKNSDAITALSPMELIRIAVNRWLKGGEV